jgi:hypothetical protein
MTMFDHGRRLGVFKCHARQSAMIRPCSWAHEKTKRSSTSTPAHSLLRPGRTVAALYRRHGVYAANCHAPPDAAIALLTAVVPGPPLWLRVSGGDGRLGNERDGEGGSTSYNQRFGYALPIWYRGILVWKRNDWRRNLTTWTWVSMKERNQIGKKKFLVLNKKVNFKVVSNKKFTLVVSKSRLEI